MNGRNSPGLDVGQRVAAGIALKWRSIPMEIRVPEASSRADLARALQAELAALGLPLREEADQSLVGEAERIRARWWFGGRKTVYRMALRLAEADRTARFREVVAERSWGIPPPTLTVETTTVSGWKRSGTRTDVAPGGGGALDYARVREAVEQAVTAAGWRFALEGGRMP